jgi:hypothetical protein
MLLIIDLVRNLGVLKSKKTHLHISIIEKTYIVALRRFYVAISAGIAIDILGQSNLIQSPFLLSGVSYVRAWRER